MKGNYSGRQQEAPVLVPGESVFGVCICTPGRATIRELQAVDDCHLDLLASRQTTRTIVTRLFRRNLRTIQTPDARRAFNPTGYRPGTTGTRPHRLDVETG